ncbi:ATP-binding protein [Mobilicoccus massiliensis]|uniref:ATP-binding protein n=1 Tax=Mobilicoccus massiliensis TaxID=1522310 RepID=UPI0009E54E7B|nr:ATP-binding protein [Mobilicoccus massiliensis]
MTTTPSAELPELPRLVRADGYLAGVCAGVARHLDVPVRFVRWVFLGATLAGGLGVAAYVLLWVMTPRGDSGRSPIELDRVSPAGALLVVGAGLLVVGGLMVSGSLAGVSGVRLGDLVPVLAVGGGAILAWSQLDQQNGRRQGAIRVLLGAVLAVTGVVVIVARQQGMRVLWDVAFATLAVLAGLALVLGPLAMRFWERLQEEQRTRIRETERADIAAHLHDSVLQTLALIQRTDDPTRVTQLARAQERELRAWLYGAPKPVVETLGAAITAAAHEIEDLHGVPVDLVVTGERPIDEAGAALVAATREALANAVRHGAPPVSAFVEIGPRLVEVFVRDHGSGFDIDAVPEDRLGVRESLFGRMERHGGSARIRRLDEGTEVILELPVEKPDENVGAAPDASSVVAEPRTPQPETTPTATPTTTASETPTAMPTATGERGRRS